MTKDNAKDYLPLVQALAEGKTIQGRFGVGYGWEDMAAVDFTNPLECYRIKPEPRRWWIVEQNPACPGLAYPVGSGMVAAGTPVIEVVEVIK